MRSDGSQVALSRDDHPLHMLAVPVSTAAILADFAGDIADGDVFLHNDPYAGGTHLNDMLMLQPVFVAGRLLFFAAVRSHWNYVGGMTPGSLSGRARGAAPHVVQQHGRRLSGLGTGAVAGRADVIDTASPARKGQPGFAYVNGTLHGNPLASAAGLATLRTVDQPGFHAC